jgi:hypothetical protein
MRVHGSIRLRVSSIVLLMGLGLMAGAATSNAAETPDPLDRMNIWAGHWKMQAQRKETAYSHAGSLSFNAVCAWAPNRGYMVCDYLSDSLDPQEGRVANHLSILTYNEPTKAYKHLGISMDFKTLEQVATVEGNVWTYLFEQVTRKGEKLQLRDVYEFVSPEKQISRFEVSADGGQHWTLRSEAVATKVSP